MHKHDTNYERMRAGHDAKDFDYGKWRKIGIWDSEILDELGQ